MPTIHYPSTTARYTCHRPLFRVQLTHPLAHIMYSGYPAHLDGYVRVFGSDSLSWGGGSVASVAPKEGGRVYGRFYCMTPQEVCAGELHDNNNNSSTYERIDLFVTVTGTLACVLHHTLFCSCAKLSRTRRFQQKMYFSASGSRSASGIYS